MGAIPLLLLLLGAPPPQPVVRSVELDGEPAVVARVERYVTLRTGEPLDPESIRQTVELLYATGEFADVVVHAEPGADGVRLRIQLLPAPLMVAVEVKGQLVIDASEARRLARLERGDALWPARLDTAARDVALALVARGFLEARVTAHAEPRDEGAAAVFEVSGGPLARVASARVEAPLALRELLSGMITPRAGQVWARPRAEKAAERMRRALAGLGYGRATVEVRETYDPHGARVDVVFLAEAGPVTRVRFEGDRLPAELRRDIERRLREAAYSADALGEASDRIESELAARGHRSARVQHHEEPSPGQLSFVYTVEAGPLATLAGVRVLGWPEAAGPPPPLASRMGEPLQETRLEDDQRTLSQALQEQGFSEARVDLDVSDGGGALPVVFRVRPGPRTLLRRLAVEGAPDGLALPPLESAAGQPLRLRALGEDRAAILTALRDAGYAQGRVVPDLKYSDDRSEAQLTLRIDPGVQTRVQRIVIAGLERTREVIVRRELRVHEGEPLGLEQVFESQKRLAQLGLFDRVTLREIGPALPGETSVVVDLHEAGRTAVAYGIGYSERELLRGSAELTLRNLSGMNRSLSFFGRLGFRGSRLYTTFREPRLFGREQELFITGFREEEDRTDFDYTRYGGFVQTARPLTPAWTAILRLGYQRTRTYNITVPPDQIDREYTPSVFSGPAASVVQDTRDDPLEPRRGHFLGGDLQVSLPALGGDGFVKSFLQASLFHPLDQRLLLALNARVGLARTFGTDEPLLPRPDRFYAGGDYSLRGWAVDSVDYNGGNGLLLGSVELRIDLRRSFALAVFSDAGNVYPAVADIRLSKLLYSAGVGLRYKTAVGPLRVDWGYKLNRRPGEKPYELHFTVGYAF